MTANLFAALKKKRPEQPWLIGFLGNDDGNVQASSVDSTLVYVRLLDGSLVTARNEAVENVWNLPVVIGYDRQSPRELRVLAVHDYGGAYMPLNRPPHHETHEFGGRAPSDVVWVAAEQFLPLLVRPDSGSLIIKISRGLVVTAGGYRYIPDQQIDLSDYVPSEGARWVLVEATEDGIGLVPGDVYESRDDLSLDNLPAAHGVALAAVRLYDGQDEIVSSRWTTDIVDLRFGFAAQANSGLQALQRVLSADFVLRDGECITLSQYVEVPLGVALILNNNSTLEVL